MDSALYGMLNNKIEEVASGISNIVPITNGLRFTTLDGTNFDVMIPDIHSHSNLATILEKFTLDSGNNLLFNGQPIKGNIDLTPYLKISDADVKYELKDNTIVKDVNYVHTDNNYTTTEKTKVSDVYNHILNISNPHNTNLSQLKDVIIMNSTDKQVLGYDLASNKFINQTNVDEKVKINATSSNKYLGEWLDGISIQNIGSKLVCKSLDGMDITLVELNRLSGLDKNIMDYLNVISNPMTVKAVVNTHADLLSIVSPMDGNVAIVKVDESHSSKQWTYIYINSTWNSIAENTINVRDFTIDKLDLTSEVKNKLPQVNMDMIDIVKTTDLTNYLKSSDASTTYATVTQISSKANSSDIYTQIQTNNLLSNKVEKVANKSLIADSEITKLQAITGTNTGDETQSTIKTKLGQANTTTNGYVSSTDWNTFNNKANTTDIPNISNKLEATNIIAGTNTTITKVGNNVTINATGGGSIDMNTLPTF